MKITIVMGFFLPVPPLAGGATEKIWHRLGQLLATKGHEVTIVSRRWPGLPDHATDGRLTYLRLPGMRHSRFLPLNLLLDLFWGLRVIRALPSADIVVCNTVSLPVFLRRLKPRAGRVAVVLGRMPKGQCRAYNRVDCILATSTAVAQRAAIENPRLAPKTCLFPNPIDWVALAAAPRVEARRHPIVIGFVGRIHPEKGLELLLAAAAILARETLLPPWRIAIVGPEAVDQGGGGESYGAQLRTSLAPSLAKLVSFAGPEYDADKLAAHYAAMDIFCYPSIAERGETFGIAIAESMAAGCAPVVSTLACFSDLVEPGETGLVFDHRAANAPAELAANLTRLLTNPTDRQRIAGRAQAHARRFDFGACARVVEQCLRRGVEKSEERFTLSPPAP